MNNLIYIPLIGLIITISLISILFFKMYLKKAKIKKENSEKFNTPLKIKKKDTYTYTQVSSDDEYDDDRVSWESLTESVNNLLASYGKLNSDTSKENSTVYNPNSSVNDYINEPVELTYWEDDPNYKLKHWTRFYNGLVDNYEDLNLITDETTFPGYTVYVKNENCVYIYTKDKKWIKL